jgi:hypothetical protein
MLMRSTAHFTTEAAGTQHIEPQNRLTIRERIVETGDWTISIPSIATVCVRAQKRPLYRGVLLTAASISAIAGLSNYVLGLVMPTLPVLIASLAVTAICALLSLRTKGTWELAFTSSDGSRCAVTSKDQKQLTEIRTFLTEKINRQDCRACRVFRLNGNGEAEPGSLTVSDAMRAISERADLETVPAQVPEPIALRPIEPASANAAQPSGSGVDYSSVLAQITDLHRFYERHPQAAHIHERLSEMELLMRSGTPSVTQQQRVRELALDLSNIMSAYPHMTQLFTHVTQLASRGT